ncbi:hypothetical protein ALC62_05090 [Cyphomyrmex costatus]|uniref:Uncharacterized protein n=1 Tax=Cyphomyrmex costatus TaxID=456900 RepID=A0A195CVZ2_9HYME|nr:hypothetical protein ALC62_05090 [Cyphomyrmex costatus]
MRNEFVYFPKSIPRWITVDAPDSRCIKAATDKFPPERKKRPFAETRMNLVALVAPRPISLGRHGSRLDRPEAACTHACSPRAREDDDAERAHSLARWTAGAY